MRLEPRAASSLASGVVHAVLPPRRRAADHCRRCGRRVALPVTLSHGWPDGVRLIRFDELDSTNEEARRLAEAGEPGPVWITAREQTTGRGRRGKLWDLGARQSLRHACCCGPALRLPRQLVLRRGLAVADVVASFRPGPPRQRSNGPTTCCSTAARWRASCWKAARPQTLAGHRHRHQSGCSSRGHGISRDRSMPQSACAVAADDALAMLAARFAAWYDVWHERGVCGAARRLAGARRRVGGSDPRAAGR